MIYRVILVFFFLVAAGTVSPTYGSSPKVADVKVTSTTPYHKPSGGKWRIGYVGSFDYQEYPRTLRAIVLGLQKLNWLSAPEIPTNLNSKDLWKWLATNVQSDYLMFVEDAWFQPRSADVSQRQVILKSITRRLQQKADIDLIIAMGTLAGQQMVTLKAPVPTVVASVSDAIGAGIVLSAEDSGLDNLHASVQVDRYRRQIELFYGLVPFKVLGMVYEDSPEGRSYAALETVQNFGKKVGVKISSCSTAANIAEIKTVEANVLACYRKLANEVDAVYVTVHRGVTLNNIGEIASVLRESKVPSFSMLGQVEVEAGLLVSLAQSDSSSAGLFHAEAIARIFNGALPRQLNQIWSPVPKLAINLDTSRRIGFDPPIDALLAADEIFGRN